MAPTYGDSSHTGHCAPQRKERRCAPRITLMATQNTPEGVTLAIVRKGIHHGLNRPAYYVVIVTAHGTYLPLDSIEFSTYDAAKTRLAEEIA
jgi:hypothetical protein